MSVCSALRSVWRLTSNSVGELGLDDPVARRELAAEDPLAEVVRDLGGQRAAQHRISATVAANASHCSSVIARLSAIIPRDAIQ